MTRETETRQSANEARENRWIKHHTVVLDHAVGGSQENRETRGSRTKLEVSVERNTKEVIVQNIQMIVEKIEKIEVHQSQFSYQMADEELRRTDDCR